MELNSRALAADVLVQVVGERKTLNQALESTLPKIPRENDRAFVQALCYGVMRWYWRLDYLVALLTRKPVKDLDIRMLAMLGLYQLKYMRVKPYAAVTETVSAARRKSWAKPFLNGILRSYLREQATLEARSAEREAIAEAHPEWLVSALQQDWPDRYAEILRQNNLAPPMVVRVNCRTITRAAYLDQLARAGISAYASPIGDTAVVLESPVPVENLPGFAKGWVSVQDAAAQLAAPLLELESGLRVLDVCAAPGGKLMHILEACPDLKEVVAVDVSPERVVRIHDNLARAGLTAKVLTADATNPSAWWDGRAFDRILLDAPCSATGVIRRHPDIKVLRTPDDLVGLQDLQRRILDAVWPLLAPGGRLLYVTCSVLRQENEARIAEFLKTHSDALDVPIKATWGEAVSHGRQILTGDQGMDGFYYARIAKI
ncbi:16S rRNA (cytosine(967)-C(5))-methyltransferase RsmB [Methylocaldum szegediense]|uniref:16S rRNA (cytosine(967)-C(5))-methyltransferase n=1 Tax=Methylocaldum szegediense TaxID=73780 RepID=A0ABM9I0J2_9GAMM|nr:16S rRNA (cytosine(967)-C(5))-methyltransferase RsmB [Methylocaldum szegediense]CAI8807753.1 16S rRNA m(5)C967 methyltransferase [Methylocaldum szegediense]